MTITQLSNLFNLIIQNDADYRFYHYGFPSDMNINIGNNYDPTSDTGRLFPYVLLLPPILNSRAMENNTAAIFDTYQVEFLITDTYAYEQGVLTYKIDTTIELEQTLQILAKNSSSICWTILRYRIRISMLVIIALSLTHTD